MSGRIALMVRGLPSILIEEAVERFGKYYPQAQTADFHQSPSFTGYTRDNTVYFTNKYGGFEGGQGLNKQTMGDLRQLKKDFEDYTYQNQGIYRNSPTSRSRSKLYKRIGFKDGPVDQIIDTRIIAPQDLPYVKALDRGLLDEMDNYVLGNKSLPAFVNNSNITLSTANQDIAARLGYIMQGKAPSNSLEEMFDIAIDNKKERRRLAKESKETYLGIIDQSGLSANLSAYSHPQAEYQPYRPIATNGTFENYDDIPF